MKKRAVGFVVLLLVVVTLAGCGVGVGSGDVGDVGRFLSDFGEAMESGNPSRVAALYQYPATFVDYNGDKEQMSKEQVEALYTLSMGFLGDGSKVSVHDYNATIADSTATVEVIYNVSSQNWGTMQSEFMWELLWNGSAWKIAEHYDMD